MNIYGRLTLYIVYTRVFDTLCNEYMGRLAFFVVFINAFDPSNLLIRLTLVRFFKRLVTPSDSAWSHPEPKHRPNTVCGRSAFLEARLMSHAACPALGAALGTILGAPTDTGGD